MAIASSGIPKNEKKKKEKERETSLKVEQTVVGEIEPPKVRRDHKVSSLSQRPSIHLKTSSPLLVALHFSVFSS